MSCNPNYKRLQLRRGSLFDWQNKQPLPQGVNPVLQDGEVSYAYFHERQYHLIKIGDGVTEWNDLPCLRLKDPNPCPHLDIIQLQDEDVDSGPDSLPVTQSGVDSNALNILPTYGASYYDFTSASGAFIEVNYDTATDSQPFNSDHIIHLDILPTMPTHSGLIVLSDGQSWNSKVLFASGLSFFGYGMSQCPNIDRYLHTQMFASSGDTLHIEASGLVYKDNLLIDPDQSGIPPEGIVSNGLIDLDCLPFQIYEMELLGRFGVSGEMFRVGNQATITAPNKGELLLFAVDSGIAYNNDGFWEVNISGDLQSIYTDKTPHYMPLMQIGQELPVSSGIYGSEIYGDFSIGITMNGTNAGIEYYNNRPYTQAFLTLKDHFTKLSVDTLPFRVYEDSWSHIHIERLWNQYYILKDTSYYAVRESGLNFGQVGLTEPTGKVVTVGREIVSSGSFYPASGLFYHGFMDGIEFQRVDCPATTTTTTIAPTPPTTTTTTTIAPAPPTTTTTTTTPPPVAGSELDVVFVRYS